MNHKAGYVNIIGNPNVGKSTLMNALVGEKVAIVTPKAQTTRHRILGIANGDDYQIVFSDTPGILKPAFKLHQSMIKAVASALHDADILMYVISIDDPEVRDAMLFDRICKSGVPLLLLINKIDLGGEGKVEAIKNRWNVLCNHAEIIPVSALKGHNIPVVMNRILALLPPSPPYFPKDQFTDRPERFFAAEFIQERIYYNYRQEIPYASAVRIVAFKEDERLVHIRAEIAVERESQKIILIGKKGKALKKTGTEARKEMEKFFGKKVFLETNVKVQKDWRNKPPLLHRFGYE